MSSPDVMGQSMHPLLELPPEVARSLAIAHVVVAEALEPSRERHAGLNEFRESHAAHGEARELLRTSLESWRDEAREAWTHPMLALVCVANPLIPLPDLAGGAFHRRVDSVLDAFDTDYCAHEVQSIHWGLVSGLVEAAESGAASGLKIAARLGLGAVGGYATAYGLAPAMSWAGQAADWLDQQGLEPDQDALDIAAVLLVWTVMADDEVEEPTPQQRELALGLQRALRETNYNAAKSRMLSAALGYVGATLHEGQVMPSLVGKRLTHAITAASKLGLTVTTVDGFFRGDRARDQWMTDHWTVSGQFPPGGTQIASEHIVLAVHKRNEFVREESVRELVEVKYRALTLGL